MNSSIAKTLYIEVKQKYISRIVHATDSHSRTKVSAFHKSTGNNLDTEKFKTKSNIQQYFSFYVVRFRKGHGKVNDEHKTFFAVQ